MAAGIGNRVPLLARPGINLQPVYAENLVALRRRETRIDIQVDAHQIHFQLTTVQLGQPRRIVLNRHDTRWVGGNGIAQRQRLGMYGQVLRKLGLGTTRDGRGNQSRENPTIVAFLSHEILPFP